jgi:uncharacterized protein YcnI
VKSGLLLVSLLAVLATPATASAHVTVLPAFVEDGQRSTLLFSAPNERAPHAVTELVVAVPRGIELSPLPAPPGWRLVVSNATARWTGGRTRPGEIGTFRLAARTNEPPAGVTIRAVQRYDDGARVPWTIPFTILPASKSPKQHLWPALITGAIGLGVIGAGLALLARRARHGSRRIA